MADGKGELVAVVDVNESFVWLGQRPELNWNGCQSEEGWIRFLVDSLAFSQVCVHDEAVLEGHHALGAVGLGQLP